MTILYLIKIMFLFARRFYMKRRKFLVSLLLALLMLPLHVFAEEPTYDLCIY